MRRTLLALLLVCGFGLSLATFSPVSAWDEATGPVPFTVHLAYCPISAVNSDVGFYEACHDNGLGGATLTFASAETEPVSFTTDAAGVGVVDILDGMSAVTQVTLSGDDSVNGSARSYAYCSDQNSGAVLFDGVVPPGGAIPLFTVDASQLIICDWYIYTDTEVAAG